MYGIMSYGVILCEKLGSRFIIHTIIKYKGGVKYERRDIDI